MFQWTARKREIVYKILRTVNMNKSAVHQVVIDFDSKEQADNGYEILLDNTNSPNYSTTLIKLY